AADYVKEKRGSQNSNSASVIAVRPGNRVRYTVPQHIDLENGRDATPQSDDKIRIMFRSTDVYRSITVAVYSGSRLIAQQKKRIVRPGEMQTIELKEKELEGLRTQPQPLTVSIELPEDSID
ncbi:MAG TPA: pyridine nucleotide-disulfide oxidoreductase, partial [Treponema sp.]|nr:pyridine nucleotide-disulfide oxidoreductase [Treponema sp.]